MAFAEYGERVTIYGLRGVHVEGHKGIEEYSDKEIRIRYKKKKIAIRGDELKLKEIAKEELFINGKIKCLEVIDER